MGKYQDISIKKLVKEINEKYFLPEIQREFIWDKDKSKFEDKLYDLFDSIMRGYPIGTLLFWDVKYSNLVEDNITVLKILDNSNRDSEIVPKDNFREKPINLVLDGQQRMTILNLAFRGVFEDEYRKKKRKRNLYINLLSKSDNSKEINERAYEFKILESKEDYFPEKDKLWWRVKKIIDDKFSLYKEPNKLAEKFNLDKSKDIIGTNLDVLQKAINNENISFYLIESDKSDEEALEIFVRVNSGGVALTYSDLLFSKIKQYWKKGERIIDAREDFKDFLNEINKDRFLFNNDFILKTSLVLIEKDIRYRVKNFDKNNVELIKNNWERIKNSIRVIVNFLNQIGINDKKSLRSNNALIPMIYYAYKRKLKEIDNTSKDFDLLRKYLYTILLNGVFGGQADSLLSDSREIIKEDEIKLFPIEDLFKQFIKRNKIIRKEDELLELLNEIRYNTDRSKLILNIIYGNCLPTDFQEDHMFSRTEMLKKHDKKIVDNISNLQPLGKFTNNSKNNKKFKEWLSESNRSEEYGETNLVPKMENYEDENFVEFTKKRKSLIFNKVKRFLE